MASARSIIWLPLATRSSAFDGMPLAPAAVTMTAPPAAAASSSASARSSDAELSIGGSAIPAAASMPARMMSMLDESIESGTRDEGREHARRATPSPRSARAGGASTRRR